MVGHMNVLEKARKPDNNDERILSSSVSSISNPDEFDNVREETAEDFDN